MAQLFLFAKGTTGHSIYKLIYNNIFCLSSNLDDISLKYHDFKKKLKLFIYKS